MKLKYTLLLAITMALSACASTPSDTAHTRKFNPYPVVDVPMIYVSIGCVGHEGVSYIHSFYVKEPFSQRMVGGLSCGGLGAFGYMLPKQWRPGMKVKVRWNRPIKGEDNWIEKTTTIRRYDEAGDLFVHFFANDEVRVVSSARFYPGSSQHPILKSVTIAPPEEE